MDKGANDSGRYKMRTFSQLTGLSPTVLRAWERRHGLLQPERPQGGHRLYTDDDLAVIRRVTAMLRAGRAIGEIAAVGRTALLEASVQQPSPSGTDSLEALAGRIVESARALDSALLSAALDRAFALFSMEVVLERVIQPAAHQIGELWAQGEIPIAGEHMVSAALSGRVEQLRQSSSSQGQRGPLVVCGCLPGEQHELGLLMLSLRISGAGFRVAYLGRDLPLEELRRAVDQLGARAACLSAKRVETVVACADPLAQLAREWSGRVRIHLGGAATLRSFDVLSEAGVWVWGPDVDVQHFLDELVGA